MSNIPKQSQALIIKAIGEPFVLETVATPTASPGEVVVEVLAAGINSLNVYRGETGEFKPLLPVVGGNSAVGRIASISDIDDSPPHMSVGQLVVIDGYIHSRSSTDSSIILATFKGATPTANKLFELKGKTGTWTQFTKVPVENVFPLSPRILKRVDQVADLAYLRWLYLPFAALRSLDVKPGETVIVAPATGKFSSATVAVASALGARVIAVGRNLDKLKVLQQSVANVEVVQLTGNSQDLVKAVEDLGGADAYIDLIPFTMQDISHISALIGALNPCGRAALLGGTLQNLSLPVFPLLAKSISVKFHYMYTSSDIKGAIALVESGLLKLGKKGGLTTLSFSLDEYEKAFDKESSLQVGEDLVFVH